MNKLSYFCIRHKVATILACVLVVIFGVMSLFSLPLSLLPDMEVPVAVVMTTYAGAGPEEIENLVTKPVEGACASVTGVDELSSVSAENMSAVVVTFVDGTDLDNASTSLREKVDQIKGSLPDDVGDPMVLEMDMDAMPIVQFSIKGMDISQLQQIAEDEISPALERIDGVASVSVSGGYRNEIAIETYSNKLEGYGLSVGQIAQQLAAENIVMPTGTVKSGAKTLNARVDGQFGSIEDIRNILIALPTGGAVRLDDIASIQEKPQDQTTISKLNGESCLTVSVQKQSGTNTVQAAENVKKTMESVTAEYPQLEYEYTMDQSEYVNFSVSMVLQNIIIGIVLAAIVLLVFLRDFGATAIISICMPICIILVFLVMRAMDITLNMMSLGGLAMGVGMIVDNSIVVLENIFRFRTDGYSRLDACVKGSGEVALSILASTLTTVCVFLPIGLSGGMVGMMFKEFSITICVLLLSSLVIALTLVPLCCYALLDRSGGRKIRAPKDAERSGSGRLMERYKKLLRFFIQKRKASMLLSVVMIGLFVLAVGTTGVILMPEMDQGAVSVTISLPIGSELADTEDIADEVVEIAYAKVPELKSISYSSGGGAMLASSSTEEATVTINLPEMKERNRSSKEIADALRTELADIAGAEITVSTSGAMDMASLTGDVISLNVSGDDYETLTMVGDDLVNQLSRIPGVVDVQSSAAEQVPQVNVYVDRDNASRFGLTAASVSSQVYSALSGSSSTKLTVSGEETDINVSGDTRYQDSIDEMKNIPIATMTGGTVPLDLVADVAIELAPQSINRTNQSRTITITGGSEGEDTSAITAAVQEIVNHYEFPDGITLETGGQMEEIVDVFGKLFLALITAIILVYFVLACQFESFAMPVIIMMILPIGLLGSLVGLPLTGNQISMTSFIGVIMLAGIVVNSSIILVDYINRRREMGEDKDTAILNACPRRVRPVLMTAATTVLGLVPMAVGGGEGSEMMAPMAIVMITGMVISTIITLLFTPVYYSVMDNMIQKSKDKRQRRKEKRLQKREAKGETGPVSLFR